jgi:hypothetical protein
MIPIADGAPNEAPNPARALRMKNGTACELRTRPQPRLNTQKRNMPRMKVYFLEIMSAIRPERSSRQPCQVVSCYN